MSNIPPIKLTPDELFQLGPVVVSNSMFTAFFITFLLSVFALFVYRTASLVPTRSQAAIEIVMEYFLNILTMVHGSEKRARFFLPLSLTLFFVILVSNQFSLVPLVDSFYVGEGADRVKLFDAPTSHYSMTIALALFSLGSAHVFALLWRPLKHVGNFIKIQPLLKARTPMDFVMALIELFLGFMDIIGEFAKVISMSTRLFGNLFAGEVILIIISGLFVFTQFVFPMPFIVIGILSGLVQAFVFSILVSLFVGASISGLELEEKQNN